MGGVAQRRQLAMGRCVVSASDELLTFDEFRESQADALRAQRERLRDDVVADGVLRTAGATRGWAVWDGNAFPVES